MMMVKPSLTELYCGDLQYTCQFFHSSHRSWPCTAAGDPPRLTGFAAAADCRCRA